MENALAFLSKEVYIYLTAFLSRKWAFGHMICRSLISCAEVMGVINGRPGKRMGAISIWDGLRQLMVLGLCFLIGTFGGFFFSVLNGDTPDLSDYLQQYLQMVGQGSGADPALWSVAWDILRWPLLAFLLGFTALGAIGLPVLFLMRGFTLSFATTTFARLFGLPGVAASLASFGVAVLLDVPILFVVGNNAFCQSLDRLSDTPSAQTPWRQRVGSLAPCGGLLLLAIALQRTVMPALLTALCAHLFTT